LILTILVPLMIYFGVKQNLKFRSAFRIMRERLAEINAQAEDNFSGIRVVKAFNAETSEQLKFAVGNKGFSISRKNGLKVMADFTITVKFFVLLITLMVLIFGGYLVINQEMTIGQLVEFILYVQLFQQPITRISSLIMMYNQAMAGFERFIQIMQVEKQKDSDDAQDVDHINGDIEFRDVSFIYDEKSERHVLKDINFKVKAGSKVAFVGPSGSGKSTLCNLIPRFYEIKSGNILIDQMDIRQYKIKNLRDHVGIVQQEVFIFAGTIGQNIQYGAIDASEAEIIEAAKKANAWEFIEILPEGLNTYIGERGVKLSGGQRQRLSLARIFLKNPPILLLDEATSALDNVTEKQIQVTLDRLSNNRTTLVVAHRLSTITDADMIYVLTKDGIIENGTHDSLLALKGQYYRLYTKESELMI
ncbi:MAG: ABC transporter ATP-binding protein, partial [Erysipelotrichaceae bacterium]